MIKTNKFEFTFENIKKYFRIILENNYSVVSCLDYHSNYRNSPLQNKILINRVDVDESISKAERLAIIFNKLGIKATFS